MKMAASLRIFHRALQLHSCKRIGSAFVCKRHLLSEAYSCKEAWNKYMEDPLLKNVSHTELAYQIHEQLEKTNKAWAVDVNILTHHFHSMDEEEMEFMEDILAKFSLCPAAFPHNDSTSHAIAVGCLAAGHGKNLINLLTDKKTYSILPSVYTLNLAMDWFIKREDYANAAKVAYCSMLQEDFSNPTNTLLSLHATVHHLLSCNIDELAPPPREKTEGEEETWVKVKYIRFPYYDDHFDIKDERFLLGKTLLALGDVKSVSMPPLLGSALKVIGYGLYQKFPQGLAFLNSVANSADGSVPEVAINYFTERLEKVEARDPNEPEVELALRTIDDTIHRLLPITDDKQGYLSELAQVKESLQTKGKILKDFDLRETVVGIVSSGLPSYEKADITAQLPLFPAWAEQRKEEVQRQMEEFRRNARIEEMKKQIKELQEQEEMLRYFDLEEKLRLKFMDEDKATDKNLTLSQ